MLDYGFKISKDGVDVKTALDKELVISSKFNQLKIESQGIFQVSVPAGVGYASLDITHNLGYNPAFLVYLEETAGSGKKYKTMYKETQKIQASTDNDKITVEVIYPLFTPNPATAIHTGYYFIFSDNLT